MFLCLFAENSICQHLRYHKVNVSILEPMYHIPDRRKYNKNKGQ